MLDSVCFISKLRWNEFYSRFSMFDAIVICQTDAVLLGEVPSEFQGYDYIGAPWIKPFMINKFKIIGFRRLGWILCKLGYGRNVWIGNGGLSWRRISFFCEIESHLQQVGIKFISINEDLVIGYLASIGIVKVPSLEIANKIFIETAATSFDAFDGVLGFHALEKFNPSLRCKIVDKWLF